MFNFVHFLTKINNKFSHFGFKSDLFAKVLININDIVEKMDKMQNKNLQKNKMTSI